ncbi:CRISPR-associated protein Cas2 [Xanthomonas nasturtii]|uniref:CRISPR-associated protein Cas2 n=1 Tax=Xanthomonas nasturtii TaxID=1843581 RepID=UPI001956CD31|nr:CRISPR-associated protein Cas2 [Xanthomonas nasturtii]WVL56464.1 CRISPR-associated protein Cas2 [Xanthomonas nasturtii]
MVLFEGIKPMRAGRSKPMANNLIVSYDLYSPGQDYSKVIEAIKALGSWAKVHKSVWYVNSSYTATQAADKVWEAMDRNDSLFVVDATSNNAAWQNLSDEVSNHVKDQWFK